VLESQAMLKKIEVENQAVSSLGTFQTKTPRLKYQCCTTSYPARTALNQHALESQPTSQQKSLN
jgi:hypothetical protein